MLEVSVASKERISISSLGSSGGEHGAVQARSHPSLGDPFLAATEVVDEAEDDVVHRVALGDRDRDGEERDAALRVQRAVDRVDHDPGGAVADDADLLRDDRRALDFLQPREDHLLGRRVDRSRLVAALAVADDRLPLGARRQLLEHAAHVLDRLAAEREPVSQHSGRNKSPLTSFG